MFSFLQLTNRSTPPLRLKPVTAVAPVRRRGIKFINDAAKPPFEKPAVVAAFFIGFRLEIIYRLPFFTADLISAVIVISAISIIIQSFVVFTSSISCHLCSPHIFLAFLAFLSFLASLAFLASKAVSVSFVFYACVLDNEMASPHDLK